VRTLLLAILFVPSLALAGDPAKPAPPPAKPAEPPLPPPAEVKATVDAFKGNWKFDATVTAPGADKPVKMAIAFNCKAVAGGSAVACDGKAKTAQGPWEASFLTAYDPYSKAVHFISVTNTFEFRDHVCQWKGADLECASMKGGTGPAGEEVTVDVKMHFEKNTCTFSSTTRSKAGNTVFEGTGKR
jgi:hypothetical protein